MIFSSLEFILFFSLFLLLIKFLPNQQRPIIIISSLIFYSFWKPIFILLLIYLFLATYYLIKKNFSLKISIPIILVPLFYFKYSFFFIEITRLNFLETLSYKSDLPLAISFITFTAIAVLVDIKTKKYNEEIDFLSFSEFLFYFPQLIAGPILRAKELIPLLKEKINFNEEKIKFGLLLFLFGFVKKIFFADSIASYIDPIFEDPTAVNKADLIKAYYLFPLQIYFDFSGYVDMALGISNILSINLPINFNKPYLSQSLTEFWRNWHITLSNWFRDYLYIPLGGSRSSKSRFSFNLIFTMSIAGLWHGASLNFIIWGFLNGLFLFFEKEIGIFLRFPKLIKIFFTCFIVFNLWVIFRIQEFDVMLNFFQILYTNLDTVILKENLLLLAVLILSIYSQIIDNYEAIHRTSKKIRFSFIIPIVVIIVITGLGINTGTSDKFIYFDF
tara:strand:+ start:708 stop:2039 length:1332 start_codon:yes stop_codon:yes gene_type:complete